ncbi:hypothetical protein [Roseobacter sp. SK209-2-6]|uniref:hypothetical protein n=1 Tax=Roseobacter sp. SK209-2-6 TaxID=388739 RepID=UPI0012F4D681|nr:hypothetical protein [Roseobacter sp. SK209-2-6]
MVGTSLSHIWMGQGSALFLEFGNLSHTGQRLGGSFKNPRGVWGVMIEWSWRIDGKKSIICGSWSDEEDWQRGFSVIGGQSVSGISLLGKLPEIQIDFANGASCTSFMTEKGQPSWAIFDRTTDESKTVFCCYGRIEVE